MRAGRNTSPLVLRQAQDEGLLLVRERRRSAPKSPRMRASFNRPAGSVDFDYDFITDREMDRHEFYNWLQKVPGVRYFMGMRLNDGETHSTFASIEFTAGHGHVTERDIEAFGHAPETSRKVTERGDISGLRKDGSEFPAEASVSRCCLSHESENFTARALGPWTAAPGARSHSA